LLQELEVTAKHVTVMEKPTYRSLCNRLSMYVTGVFSFLNTHTRLHFDNQLVCFNIGEMPRQVKPALMFLILDFVYLRMRQDREKKLLVVDEAWSLLGRAQDATYLFEIVKTCRKFSLGLLLITQDVADLLRSDAGQAVLANTSYTMLLRQKAAVIDEVTRTFHLSGTERDRLLTAQRGEGLLLMENEHTELTVTASAKETEMIEQVAEPVPVQEGKAESVRISVPVDTPLHRVRDLSSDEVQFLQRHGFARHTFVGIDSPGPQAWLLKCSSRESPEHCFLVHHIADFLRSKAKEVRLYETRGPDIVFALPDGKEFALEVESGAWLRSDKKGFLEKVTHLDAKYGRNWAFVVTKKGLARSYRAYGKVLSKGGLRDTLGGAFR